tara:strand:+ start:6673 stop:6957 length:285 start_codon:yes stop_codon:yes gene_type:complete
LDIQWITCNNNIEWDELGISALNKTKSSNVLLIGGGSIVQKEYKYFLDENIRNISFVSFPFKRGGVLGVIHPEINDHKIVIINTLPSPIPSSTP